MLNLDQIKMHDLLYDKSVVLVGGKEREGYEDAIMTCADLVVRVNQHVLSQGGRCDGLYCATADPCRLDRLESPPLFLAYRVSGLFQGEFRDYARKNRCIQIPFQNERYGKVNPIGVDYEWTNTFSHELVCKPFTGTLAIKHLCSYPIKTLHITGMDMHIIGADVAMTTDGHTILKCGPHEIGPQIRWLKKYAKCDKRITLDPVLREVLYGE